MCLIIKCKKELPISKALMEHWCEKNGDGWGMMWIKDNSIQVYRSMENKDALWNKYQELIDFNPIIHLRWRTHGDTDLANCHPYYCGHGIFLMHNGIISDANQHTPTKSDTWHFIEDWIKAFFSLVKNPHQVMRSEAFKKILEKAVGSNNKIVLGDRGGFVYFNDSSWYTITNEHTGVVGLQVSNTYAWDSFGYGKPKVKYDAKYFERYVNPHVVYPYDSPRATSTFPPIKHIDGNYRNTIGEVMTPVVGNIYIDKSNQAWIWMQGMFQRTPEVDKNIRRQLKKDAKKKKKESKQTSLILLPSTKPNSIIVVNEPNTIDETAETCIQLNTNEYNDILVKQWKNETAAAIHTLVYAEPEDAATVLCRLMGKT